MVLWLSDPHLKMNSAHQMQRMKAWIDLLRIQEALFPNYENTNLLNDGQMFDQEVVASTNSRQTPIMDGDYIINGGFKIGFGMAPELASVLISLICDGVDKIPEAFRPKNIR